VVFYLAALRIIQDIIMRETAAPKELLWEGNGHSCNEITSELPVICLELSRQR